MNPDQTAPKEQSDHMWFHTVCNIQLMRKQTTTVLRCGKMVNVSLSVIIP